MFSDTTWEANVVFIHTRDPANGKKTGFGFNYGSFLQQRLTPYGRQMIAAAAAIKVGVTTANLDEGGSLRTGPWDSSHPWTGSRSALKQFTLNYHNWRRRG